jgi:D-alanine transaminase
MTQLYLNGQWLAPEDAKVSVFDRGFLFADGVYEVVTYYKGVAYFIRDHFDRLERSCQALDISCPMDFDAFQKIADRLARQSLTADCMLYCQITRGQETARHHLPAKGLTPTVLMMTQRVDFQTTEALSAGFHAITLEDNRWQHCHIKSTALLANVMAMQQAKAADPLAVEAIYFANGHLVEGASSAVFAVIDNALCVPPLSDHILPSVTRKKIMMLAQQLGLKTEERNITLADFQNSSEVMIASATRTIAPIVTVDHRPVGSGIAGPIWKQLIQSFKKATSQL